MNRYRILWKDDGGACHFQDVEADSLAHAIWELAKAVGGELVDTMALPSTENSYGVPYHVDLYPEWVDE